MAEQLPDTYYRTPFKFNGKELDEETGLYYYGARYYDPKISIWLSVDPLAEKYPDESPYIYCGNNPIVFIDPDGMDRIYSASGWLLEDTGKGNLIKVQIGNKRVNLSALNYNSSGTRYVVSKIIAKEASVRGYKGKYGLYKGDRGGAYTNPITKDVRFNINELKKGSYDDYNTLRNVIGHEADLVYGHKGENILSENYTYLDHAKVYLGQALDKDFENSSITNQATTAEGLINRLYGSAVKESGVNFDQYIEKFNNNKGRVKIISINGNNGTMEYSIDGQNQGSKDIIIPPTPQD
jgi:RHS repeat-associated protein